MQFEAKKEKTLSAGKKMTWGFVTCGPNEALVVSGKYLNMSLSHLLFNWAREGTNRSFAIRESFFIRNWIVQR